MEDYEPNGAFFKPIGGWPAEPCRVTVGPELENQARVLLNAIEDPHSVRLVVMPFDLEGRFFVETESNALKREESFVRLSSAG